MKRRGPIDEPDPNPCVVGAVALLSAAMHGVRHGEVELAIGGHPISDAAHTLFLETPVKPYAHQLVTAAAELLRRAASPDHAQLPIAAAGDLVAELEGMARRRPWMGALRGLWLVAHKKAPNEPLHGPRAITPQKLRDYRRVNDAIDAGFARMTTGRLARWAELTEVGQLVALTAGWGWTSLGQVPPARRKAGARRDLVLTIGGTPLRDLFETSTVREADEPSS